VYAPAEEAPRPPRTVAGVFVACLVLLQATSAGLVVAGGRGRVVEILVVGAGCAVSYLVGWRRGRWTAALVPIAFLYLESRYGRLGHARYWEEVALAAGGGGSALASCYLRLTVDRREAHVDAMREQLDGSSRRSTSGSGRIRGAGAHWPTSSSVRGGTITR